MSSALQTESTKMRKENYTIHVKKTRINNIFSFNIFKIKWPKSGEKINFGGRWVWLSKSSSTPGADPAGGLRGSEPLPNDKGRSCAEGAEAPISILFRQ